MPTAPLSTTLIRLSKVLKQQIKQEFDLQGSNIPYELFSQLRGGAKNINELASLMHCSKQEASRQVKRALTNDWVTITSDQQDKRKKLVCFSAQGIAMLKQGSAHYQTLEQQWQEALGQEKMQQLHALLGELEQTILPPAAMVQPQDSNHLKE